MSAPLARAMRTHLDLRAEQGVDLTEFAHRKLVDEARELEENPSLEEVADVLICLAGVLLANEWTVSDLDEAVRVKCQVNRTRQWVRQVDGTYQHYEVNRLTG